MSKRNYYSWCRKTWLMDGMIHVYYFWIKKKGYTATSIRKFCEIIGVAKRENVIDVSLLEFVYGKI
jgi:hypothetical protein